jgi:hypothetical protein
MLGGNDSSDDELVHREVSSPNHNERTLPISMVVLHYTEMKPVETALARMSDPAASVSAHYCITEVGEVIRLVGIDPALLTGKPALVALGVPCFATGTMILTETGERAVETLQAGDRVMTLDHGLQPILWAGGRHLDRAALEREPLLRPVMIRDGALGNRGDVLVSPNHAVLVDLDGQEMLVRAKHLAELDDPRFRIAKGKKEVGYHHILLGQHGIVYANGMATETLYPGPMAVAALGPEVAAEIGRAVPILAPVMAGLIEAVELYGPTARPVAKRRQLHPVGEKRRAAA